MLQSAPSTLRAEPGGACTAIRHTGGLVRAARAPPAGARLAAGLPNLMDDLAAAKNAKQTAPRRSVFGSVTGPAGRMASRFD